MQGDPGATLVADPERHSARRSSSWLALQLPAPFDSAEDVDDVFACRVLDAGVLCKEHLGSEDSWPQVTARALAHMRVVVEAGALVAVNGGDPATRAIERVGCCAVNNTEAVTPQNLNELQVAVHGMMPAAGLVHQVKVVAVVHDPGAAADLDAIRLDQEPRPSWQATPVSECVVLAPRLRERLGELDHGVGGNALVDGVGGAPWLAKREEAEPVRIACASEIPGRGVPADCRRVGRAPPGDLAGPVTQQQAAAGPRAPH